MIRINRKGLLFVSGALIGAALEAGLVAALRLISGMDKPE